MVEEPAQLTEIAVACGIERGVFEFSKFGPGGASRCIRFTSSTGCHYITPIEFEALAGKERDWKKNVRLASNNKQVKTEIFDRGLVTTCPKPCQCNNCELARHQPTNLEKLIDTVYSPKKKVSETNGPKKTDVENGPKIKSFDSPKLKSENNPKQTAENGGASPALSPKSRTKTSSLSPGPPQVPKRTRNSSPVPPTVTKTTRNSSLSPGPPGSKVGRPRSKEVKGSPVINKPGKAAVAVPPPSPSGLLQLAIPSCHPSNPHSPCINTSVCKLSPPMDEFYTSPEMMPPRKPSGNKESSETSAEKAVDATDARQSRKRAVSSRGGSKVLPDLVPLFEVAAEKFAEGMEDGKPKDVDDEMLFGVKETPEPKKRQQSDIRSFFESPSASPRAKVRSPSPVKVLAPMNDIDLAKHAKQPENGEKVKPTRRRKSQNDNVPEEKKTPQMNGEKRGNKKRRAQSLDKAESAMEKKIKEAPEIVAQVNGDGKSTEKRKPVGRKKSPEKKSPKFKRAARGLRMPDRVEVVKEKHSLSRKGSLSQAEIQMLVEGDDGEVNEVNGTEEVHVVKEVKDIEVLKEVKDVELLKEVVGVLKEVVKEGDVEILKDEQEVQVVTEKKRLRGQAREIQPKEAELKEEVLVKEPQIKDVQLKEGKPKKVQPKESQPKEVQPTEVQPLEFPPKEAKPKKVQSKDIQPKENQPKEVKAKKVKSKDIETEKGLAKELEPEKDHPKDAVTKRPKRQLEMSIEQNGESPKDEVTPRQRRGREAAENKAENGMTQDDSVIDEELATKRAKLEEETIESPTVKKIKEIKEPVKKTIIITKDEPKTEEKPKVKKDKAENEGKTVIVYEKAMRIKKEKGEEGSMSTSPVKHLPAIQLSLVSPGKLPTMTSMIRLALEEMNVVGGEGCTKLEILLYILRKFRPKGNISVVSSKMIQILDQGTKQGDFMSSVSLPRKAFKKDKPAGDGELKEGENEKNTGEGTMVNGKPTKKKVLVKKTKVVVDKNGKKVIVNKVVKMGKNGEKKVKKDTPVQSPKKLKEPLATICKARKLTRYEVLKKIWTYIRVKKLQDPKDKTIIICDDNFRKLTKLKQISTKSVVSYLKPHMDAL